MPDTTPIFGLPYPDASDQPCDFAEQWCDFTEAVDGVFSVFETGLARTNPIVPMVLIKQTQAITVPNLQPIPFDTVLVDTAGMADLDTSPFVISIPVPGRYMVNAFLEKPSSGTALNSEFTFTINNGFTSVETLERGVIQYRMTPYNSVLSLGGGAQLSIAFNTGTAGSYPITQAWLAVVWFADREVPV